MRRFFHPPPPASSLTRFDRHCYNHLSCHHLTSLLLVLCLALSLVACQSGGSSASSANNDENISVKDSSDGSDSSDINGDETPTLVDNADIVFSSVDTSVNNSEDTKVGMREFLLTVTYNNLNTKQELNFIVGESTTPPTWNSVKANPTTITRAFNNGNLKTRRIYFSATEKLTGVSFDKSGDATITGKVIDLSQAGSQGDEADYTKAQAPGIMIPSTSYYVYVYDSRGALVKQQTVTTAGYPDQSEFATAQIDPTKENPNNATQLSNEAYYWGDSIWSRVLFNPTTDSDAEKNKLGVEMRRGEVVFYPMRRRPSFDWDQDFTDTEKASGTYNCNPASYQHKLDIRERVIGLTFESVVIITKDGVEKTGGGLVFFKSPSLLSRLSSINPAERNRVFDIMYLVRPNSDYDNFEKCRNGSDFFEELHLARKYKQVSLLVSEYS